MLRSIATIRPGEDNLQGGRYGYSCIESRGREYVYTTEELRKMMSVELCKFPKGHCKLPKRQPC